jgi:2-oxoglutarate ferredoxin oxidoreductase subunit delta
MATSFSARGYHPAMLVDPDGQCTGCLLCATICPDVAITVYRETKPASSSKLQVSPI